MTLQSDDYTNYDNFSVRARICAEDLYSEVEAPKLQVICDQFTVEVRDECHDIVVRQDGVGNDNGGLVITRHSDALAASASSPFEYDMWQQQHLDISRIYYANENTPTVALGHTKCPVDYEITDINAERSELFGNDYYITPDDGSDTDQTLRGIWDPDAGGEKDGYFWIRAIVYNNRGGGDTEVLINETEFWVNIVDPCIVT